MGAEKSIVARVRVDPQSLDEEKTNQRKTIEKVGRLDEEKTNVVLLGPGLIRQVSARRKSTNDNSFEKVTKLDEEKTNVLLPESGLTRKVCTRRK